MKEATAKFAVHVVGDRVGIAVAAKTINDHDEAYLELTPTDCHPNEGFSVQFRPGWRSVEAVFVPGPYSGQLIARMGWADLQAKKTFGVFAAVASKKMKVLMRVNGSDVSPLDPEAWPTHWSRVELQLKQTPIVVDAENEAQQEHLITELVVPIFAMVVALIGAEENELPTTGELEGRAIQTIATRYERNRLNREACIQLKGTRCTVCGFDFSETYGALGIGYIEVHHLTPVSSIGADYRIDVASDLAPLCSNCHAMAHREEPPIPLERLQDLIRQRQHTKQTEV
jgi:5-methylcytosine-specific restriction protein A